MGLKQDTLVKLTQSLAGDTELYNTLMEEVENTDKAIAESEEKIQKLSEELEKEKEKSSNFATQIGNLATKIHIADVSQPQTLEAKLEEIKNRKWEK